MAQGARRQGRQWRKRKDVDMRVVKIDNGVELEVASDVDLLYQAWSYYLCKWTSQPDDRRSFERACACERALIVQHGQGFAHVNMQGKLKI
jgi:hypothetical protein